MLAQQTLAQRTCLPSPPRFRAAMAELPAAVTVVTAWDDTRPVGTTVSAVSSLSLDPPMVLTCLSRTSDTLAVLQQGSPIAVNLLADGQQDLACAFARKAPDKFDGVDWQIGEHGLPELPGSTTVVAGRVTSLVDGGDHVVVLIGVEWIDIADDQSALVIHRGDLASHPPKRPVAQARS